MNYVTDLLAVKPEEIQHIDGLEVQGIVHCPDTIAHGTVTHRTVVVVFKNGGFAAYTPDGKGYPGDTQKFVYKPRTKRVLKPLHQILAENPGYLIDDAGNFSVGGVDIYNIQLEYFVCKNTVGQGWPESFYTEVED